MENPEKDKKTEISQEQQEPRPEKEDLPPMPEKKRGRFGMGGLDMKSILVTAIIALVVVIVLGYLGIGNWVTKKDFATNLDNMNDSINQVITDANAKLDTMNSAIQGIPTTVNTAISNASSAVTSQINTLTSRYDSLNTTIQGLSTTIQTNKAELLSKLDAVNVLITGLRTDITALQTAVTALQTKDTGFETRIAALESKFIPSSTSSGSGGNDVISIKADVLEEGVFQISDNKTFSQIKLTITNLTNTNLEDISIAALVTIENTNPSSDLAMRPTITTTGWYVRDWDGNTLEIRSASNYTLDAGAVKKVYLNIYSYGYSYLTGDITYADISNSDIEVRTYSVK